MPPCFLIGALLLQSLLSSPFDTRCTCEIVARGVAPASHARWSDRAAIFIGNAIEVEPFNTLQPARRVRFIVEASWRGAMRDTVTLVVGQDAPCAHFIAGGRYLVPAHISESRTSSLTTAACDDAWLLGNPASKAMLAELGAPNWFAERDRRRSIDSLVTAVGQKPKQNTDIVHVGVGIPDLSNVSRVEIADQTWVGPGSTPIFRLSEGLYRVRVRWRNGAVSETYLSARCEDRGSNPQCGAFRYLAGLREPPGPGGR